MPLFVALVGKLLITFQVIRWNKTFCTNIYFKKKCANSLVGYNEICIRIELNVGGSRLMGKCTWTKKTVHRETKVIMSKNLQTPERPRFIQKIITWFRLSVSNCNAVCVYLGGGTGYKQSTQISRYEHWNPSGFFRTIPTI